MFLTLEDPNAKLKGSRDPLGAQPIWAAFGRHVVSNLTMQTTSVRGFTILLLGRYFGARLIDEGRVSFEDALDVFLRMEEIGAYARHVAHEVEGDIRGIERVRSFVEEKKGRVDIQADRRGYILADQKITGLWGLYSVAARVSGWISPGSVGIEPVARAFVESHYLPILAPALEDLMRLLERGGTLNVRGRDSAFKAVAAVLPERFTPNEIDFYGEYLRDARHVAGFPSGRQERFRTLLEAETNLDGPIGREEALGLVEAAQPVDPELSRLLERIVKLEALLAPAGAIFDFILNGQGQRIDKIATDLVDRWGRGVPNIEPSSFRDLLPEIAAASNKSIAGTIDKCQSALARGAFADAVRLLMDWNSAVMRERKAGPWVALDAAGRLDVRYRGAEQELPNSEVLPTLWRNGYFIDSLKRITRQLQAVA